MIYLPLPGYRARVPSGAGDDGIDTASVLIAGASNKDEPVVPVKKDAAFPGLKVSQHNTPRLADALPCTIHQLISSSLLLPAPLWGCYGTTLL